MASRQNLTDYELIAYGNRVSGQTVLITGGGKGIGRAAALLFAQRGAKVVVGDIDGKAVTETVELIKSYGGQAVGFQVDVSNWDQICSYFSFAMNACGRIDIIIANADVGEVSSFMDYEVEENGLPQQPNLKAIDIGLVGTVSTIRLAVHFFGLNPYKDSLKALVLNGALSSISGIKDMPLSATAKHGALGLTRSIRPEAELCGMRLAIVTPWAMSPSDAPSKFKTLVPGIPFSQFDRVVGSILLAATDLRPETHGAVYAVPSEGPAYRTPHTYLSEGVYGLLNSRVKTVMTVKAKYAQLKRLFAFNSLTTFIPRLVIYASLGAVGFKAWRLRASFGHFSPSLIAKMV